MLGARRVAKHAQLVNAMADKSGVDLPRALASGLVTGEGLRTAVVSCMGCTQTDECAQHLSQAEEAAAPPDFCRNRDVFLRLRALAD